MGGVQASEAALSLSVIALLCTPCEMRVSWLWSSLGNLVEPAMLGPESSMSSQQAAALPSPRPGSQGLGPVGAGLGHPAFPAPHTGSSEAGSGASSPFLPAAKCYWVWSCPLGRLGFWRLLGFSFWEPTSQFFTFGQSFTAFMGSLAPYHFGKDFER